MSKIKQLMEMQDQIKRYLEVMEPSNHPEYVWADTSRCTSGQMELRGASGTCSDEWSDAYHEMTETIVPIDFFEKFDEYYGDALEKAKAKKEARRQETLKRNRDYELSQLATLREKYPDE